MTSEAITIFESRGKLLLYATFFIVLTSAFTILVWADWQNPVDDAFGRVLCTAIVALFWIGCGEVVRRLIWPVKLVLSDDGLWFRHWTSRQVRWSEIEQIKLVYSRYDLWARRMIYHDEPPGLAQVGWVLKSSVRRSIFQTANERLSGVTGLIPKSMNVSAVELAPIMANWLERHSPPTDHS